MRTPFLLMLVACGKKEPVLYPDKLSLDVIAVDQSNHTLVRKDELYGNDWSVELPLGARDIAVVDEDTVLVNHNGGAMKIDVHTGETVSEIGGYLNIEGAFPQPDGSVTLLTFNGTAEMHLITIDYKGDESGEQIYPGYRNVKIVREGPENHLMFTTGEPWSFLELDARGNEFYGGGIPRPGYMMTKEDDGHYYVSTTTGLTIAVFGREGGQPTDITTYSGATDAERFKLESFAGFDVTPGGLVVTTNQGSDPDRAHAVAFDSTGQIVWSWTDPELGLFTNLVVMAEHFPE